MRYLERVTPAELDAALPIIDSAMVDVFNRTIGLTSRLGTLDEESIPCVLSLSVYRLMESLSRCPICYSLKRLVRDHDHNNGLRRSCVCDDCNLSRGTSGENPDFLQSKASYIRTWKKIHEMGIDVRPWKSRSNLKPYRLILGGADPLQPSLF